MHIRCWTKFDITATGVTGHLKTSRMPFNDHTGQIVSDDQTWNRSRNQQRNWETLQQLISLRAQVFDLTLPVENNGIWSFDFTVEQQELYTINNDPVGILKQDCTDVPMLTGLLESSPTTNLLYPGQNIGFEIVE